MTAKTVARRVLENILSIQFIMNPLSKISSRKDSIQITGIIDKNRTQVFSRLPNLLTASSLDVSGDKSQVSCSLMISKMRIDPIANPRVNTVAVTSFLM